MKTFQYRLYPTKEQQHRLSRQIEECRWLWNTLLAERKQAWEERHETVAEGGFPRVEGGATAHPGQGAPQVLQDVVLRLKKAFDAFFRRLRAGEAPSYPRLRGRGALTA